MHFDVCGTSKSCLASAVTIGAGKPVTKIKLPSSINVLGYWNVQGSYVVPSRCTFTAHVFRMARECTGYV